MTDYFPNTSACEGGGRIYSPTSEAMAINSTRAQKGLSSVDSVDAAVNTVKAKTSFPERPLLPPSASSPSADEMMLIAEDFCAAYTAMKNSTLTEIEEYAGMQQLDQTQVESVLKSTSDAISKLKVAAQKAAEIQAYEAKLATFETWFGRSTLAIGIFLACVAIGSAIVTFGASLAVVPELGAMFETADICGTEVAEGVGEGVADAAAEAAESAAASSSETAGSSSGWSWGSVGMRMGVAGAFASPLLVAGIANLVLKGKLDDLQGAQLNVGPLLDQQTRNNMYLQFLQQLVQRAGGIATEEAKDAGEVIDTYASVTSAIRGISYGLANSV